MLSRALFVPLLLATFTAHAVEISPVAGYRLTRSKVSEFDSVSFYVACKKPTCVLKGVDAKSQFTLEGRVERSEIGRGTATAIGAAQVLSEHVVALGKLGGTLLNPETGANGPAVFALPARDGAARWVVLDDNFGSQYNLTVVTQQAARASSIVATDLARSIASDGWATLYIEFDTNKSDLKADGQAAVTEITKLLRQDPGLRLSVDGHTDNVGDPQANRTLSLARAQAVMAAVLVHGIDAKRLSAKGLGQEVPIADNRRETGRAKNRRVELTRQL